MHEYIQKQCQFMGLREKLVSRQQPTAEELTGVNMAKFLSDIENVAPIKSPYNMQLSALQKTSQTLTEKASSVVLQIEETWSTQGGNRSPETQTGSTFKLTEVILTRE